MSLHITHTSDIVIPDNNFMDIRAAKYLKYEILVLLKLDIYTKVAEICATGSDSW